MTGAAMTVLVALILLAGAGAGAAAIQVRRRRSADRLSRLHRAEPGQRSTQERSGPVSRWIQQRRRDHAEASALPLAADLLAVVLRGGAPPDQACTTVAEVIPGPLGARLARVGRSLALGATPAQAWAELAPVAGADRLVRAAVRSAERGSALAEAFGRIADDLRADRAVAAETAARRAGVLIVLPLGLCFLPAFVLAGLVPVILAVLGEVL